MKFLLSTLFLFTLAENVCAERFTSTIHSIDYGNGSASHLVRFNNGRVTFVKYDDEGMMASLERGREKQDILEVKIGNTNNLASITTVASGKYEDDDDQFWGEGLEPYEPSVLKNYNAAFDIFTKMRRKFKSSGQCYSRAHIWSYEEYRRSGLNSMKIFMFFTEKYIRRYRYHWWFHVTPMFYVTNMYSPRTLDRRYTSGPKPTKVWSDIFIHSKRTCKIVEKFDDFFENQQSQDCYHIYASMYYVIPRDLEKRDLTGLEKIDFNDKEVRRAYSDGFGIRIR